MASSADYPAAIFMLVIACSAHDGNTHDAGSAGGATDRKQDGSSVSDDGDDATSEDADAAAEDSGSGMLDADVAAVDGGSQTLDGGGALTATAACLESTRVQCERKAECGLYDSVDRCWRSFAGLCPDMFFSPGSTRTAENAHACLDAWRRLSCDDIWRGIAPACSTPGTRGRGETCLFSSQCASSRCSTLESTRCGTCVGFLREAEACRTDERGSCAVGLFCEADAGVCARAQAPQQPPRLPLGAACQPGDCGENLCARADDGGFYCVQYPRLGQPCSAAGACAPNDGSYCDGAMLVCVELPSAGEPCGTDPGGAHWCDQASTCDDAGDRPRCRLVPIAVQNLFEEICRP